MVADQEKLVNGLLGSIRAWFDISIRSIDSHSPYFARKPWSSAPLLDKGFLKHNIESNLLQTGSSDERMWRMKWRLWMKR